MLESWRRKGEWGGRGRISWEGAPSSVSLARSQAINTIKVESESKLLARVTGESTITVTGPPPTIRSKMENVSVKKNDRQGEEKRTVIELSLNLSFHILQPS